MKNKIIILFLVFTNIHYSQNESIEESLKYYPLEIGNYWQFESSFHDGWGNDSSWYAYREVVGDTIMQNGINYFIIVESGIKTLSSNFVRIDSTNGYIYSYKNITEEYSEDSLVLSYWDSLNCEYVDDVYNEELFGTSFETRLYNGCTVSSGCSKFRKMSKNIGLIELKIFCANVVGSDQIYSLNYAKIDDVEYGTLVGINTTNLREMPSTYLLQQNYPNPFNPTTEITFYLPKRSFINLSIYDVLGKEVSTLFDGIRNEGNHKIIFDAKNYSSGIYYYTLNYGESRISKKMSLIK